MLKHLKLQEERDYKAKLAKVQKKCDKRRQKNQELDVVTIPELERRLDERYAEMSVRGRSQLEELDNLHDTQTLELNQLRYINEEIQKNELPSDGSLIDQILKVQIEIEMLKKQLKRGDKAVTNRYQIYFDDDDQQDEIAINY